MKDQRTILQITPASDAVAEYLDSEGKSFTLPVIAWALVEEQVVRPDAFGTKRALDRYIVGLVMTDHDPEIDFADDARNFVGYARAELAIEVTPLDPGELKAAMEAS